MKGGDSITEEQKKLAEDNHNLIYSFLNKYHWTADEYYGDAAIGLCRAAIAYNKEKGEFSSYAYKCMLNSVLTEIIKKTRQKFIPDYALVSYDAEKKENINGDTASLIDFIPSEENAEDEAIFRYVLSECMNSLKKERDKIVFKLFVNEYKQTEISRIVGCPQQYISEIKKKIIRIIEQQGLI